MNHKRWQYLALLLLVFIEVQGLKPKPLTIQAMDSSINNDSGPSPFQADSKRARVFEIDYERDMFLMDGEPFQFIAGSFHYFRCPHQYWRDRLRTMRAAGLNAVTTYVEWSFHEPKYREYKWSGDKDLVKFIEIAQDEGLYVILRPGPYICAERDMGGFPYWLLTLYPSIKLRTDNSDYEREVRGWYAELMPKVERLLYGNGGPIIMVQVENEYGSYAACDKRYMSWLGELTEIWVRGAALLFTTDGTSVSALSCGSTPGAYATVDFGTGQNMTAAWESMRKFSPKGPLINSEFYPGWLTHWGENAISVSSTKVVEYMEKMFAVNASFNFYMFYGGTNFAFTAGANLSPMYVPDITSYDYDAPMTEAGDPTPKYMDLRRTIGKYFPLPDIPVPEVKPKGNYGNIALNPTLPLLSNEGLARLGTKKWNHMFPKTMEYLEQYSGFVLYATTIPAKRPDPSVLTLESLGDRALVYVDNVLTGVLSRTREILSLPIMGALGNNLQLLVENQGRVNYLLAEDFKGIKGNVLFNKKVLVNWDSTNIPLESIEPEIEDLIEDFQSKRPKLLRNIATDGILRDGPVVYSKKFVLNDEDPLDTYLDVTGWGKGIAWLNNNNLGRYWPGEGPQITLYVPGVYFNKYPQNNTLILLELQSAPENFSVNFVNQANLGKKKHFG